ncbi:MAG TPA: amino acid permease [Polyangia bacterium]|nr:amino acid permease [Polyangia bacterium]HVZ88845.1 amino acid permease [Polyangia bacterium]
MASRLFAIKSIDALRSDAAGEHGLKRALGPIDLMLLGIGAIIGTGIFVLTGQAAADNAGPAVVLSFVAAGIASGFAGLCYAEMASMIPIAGSAYTYSYATMGELVAWIIGWDLILEYLVASAAVSVGWSGYAVAFVHDVLGITLPETWTRAPFVYDEALSQFHATGAVLNVPAMLVTAVVTVILVIGIKESARFNSVIVTVKVAVVLLFIAFCARFVNTANWHPFIPPEQGHGHYGFSGVMRGAARVFFAYIGFDAVSTAAQETRNPQRDLPFGILGSLAVCTILYVAVSAVLTGIVPYTQLAVPHPIAVGVEATGQRWLATLVEIGAIAGLSSVMLVMMMGQPRIFFSMATDGLLPPGAARVHPRFGTPWVTTIITGSLVAVAGGLLPVGVLAQLTSVGTLFAFVLVSLGVLILRRKRPDIPRGFRVPGGTYLVPLCGAATSLYLMLQESASTLIRLFGWMAIGLVVYGLYGRKHSKLAR